MPRTYYRTTITEVGPEVADLVEGGVLILFATGSPAELAEVSVLHTVSEQLPEAPPVGASIEIGAVKASLTAIGALAWNKIGEMGHVVINFDGSTQSNRPGELSASKLDNAALVAALQPGVVIAIAG